MTSLITVHADAGHGPGRVSAGVLDEQTGIGAEHRQRQERFAAGFHLPDLSGRQAKQGKTLPGVFDQRRVVCVLFLQKDQILLRSGYFRAVNIQQALPILFEPGDAEVLLDGAKIAAGSNPGGVGQ